jgi:hypothetical protein
MLVVANLDFSQWQKKKKREKQFSQEGKDCIG